MVRGQPIPGRARGTAHAVPVATAVAITAATRIPLGRSGLEVAPLGWGMWRFAGADPDTAQRRIEAALDIGCTLFDTADIYGYSTPEGFGGAEILLGRLLRAAPALRQRMVLATKGGIFPPLPYDSSAGYLTQACEKSLQRLGIDCIDLYQVHRPDLLTHPHEVAATLERLRQAGKIRAAGVSNYSAAQLDALCACMPFALASIQPEFSPLVIEPLTGGVLDAAMRHGLAVLAWSPLAQGRLGAAHVPPLDPPAQNPPAAASERTRAVCAALDRIAVRAGVPRSAAAYAWIMAHPSRPVPLIGSQNPARIREAAAAYAVHIGREEWYQVLEAARGAPLP
jgi:aryl-alcohol dehydrogenase-like predicted oxidoreductase